MSYTLLGTAQVSGLLGAGLEQPAGLRALPSRPGLAALEGAEKPRLRVSFGEAMGLFSGRPLVFIYF